MLERYTTENAASTPSVEPEVGRLDGTGGAFEGPRKGREGDKPAEKWPRGGLSAQTEKRETVP